MKKPSWSHPHQKLGLTVVVVIGLTTLIFGVIGLRKSIFDPFVRRPSAIAFKSSDELEKERIQALKSRDTDGDGLSDYDELYIYRTSPFLEDSDSDGIPDGVEVKNGTDPNCPKDKVCRQIRTSSTTDQTAVAPDLSYRPAPDAAAGPADVNAAATVGQDSQGAAIIQLFTDTFGPVDSLTPEIIAAKLQTMSTDDLRNFYKKLGLPAASVDKVDDATLRKLFLETIKDLASQVGAMSTNAGTAGTPPAPSQ
jgi:hypothetical protein